MMRKETILIMTILTVTAFFAEQGFGTVRKISKLSVADITSADVGESWISVAGTGASLGTITLEIKFNDEEVVDVPFESVSDGTVQFYSLQDVVDKINIASNNPDTMYDLWGNPFAYTAAYIIDSTVTPGEYGLKIISRGRTTLPMEFFTTSSTNAVLSGNFGDAGTDLTGDNIYFFSAVAESGTYSGGDGSTGNPFLISDANDMNEIGANSNDSDKHFLVINDINMSQFTGTQFNMIGDFTGFFTGVFDGNNHTISNFTYDSPGTSYVGLFSFVDTQDAVIKDLGMIDPNVRGHDYIGALVGKTISGTVSNCFVQGGSVSGDYAAGGLIGSFSGDNSVINNCHTTCTVTGYSDWEGSCVGGLVAGMSYETTISNCYATGAVTGVDVEYVGGLVGFVGNKSTISNSYAAGKVDGNDYVGGLVGYSHDHDGYFCSYNNNFWDSDINPDVNGIGSATDPNVTGKSTVQMKQEDTFVGWDFIDTWNIGENQTYPYLRVYPAGDLNHDGIVSMPDFAIFADHWLMGLE